MLRSKHTSACRWCTLRSAVRLMMVQHRCCSEGLGQVQVFGSRRASSRWGWVQCRGCAWERSQGAGPRVEACRLPQKEGTKRLNHQSANRNWTRFRVIPTHNPTCLPALYHDCLHEESLPGSMSGVRGPDEVQQLNFLARWRPVVTQQCGCTGIMDKSANPATTGK